MTHVVYRADSRLAPTSQWETSLQSNTVSYWLGANLESALYSIACAWKIWENLMHLNTIWTQLANLYMMCRIDVFQDQITSFVDILNCLKSKVAFFFPFFFFIFGSSKTFFSGRYLPVYTTVTNLAPSETLQPWGHCKLTTAIMTVPITVVESQKPCALATWHNEHGGEIGLGSDKNRSHNLLVPWLQSPCIHIGLQSYRLRHRTFDKIKVRLTHSIGWKYSES